MILEAVCECVHVRTCMHGHESECGCVFASVCVCVCVFAVFECTTWTFTDLDRNAAVLSL